MVTLRIRGVTLLDKPIEQMQHDREVVPGAGVEGVRVRLRRGAGGSRAQAVRRGQNDGEVGVTISIGVAERDPERRTCTAIVDAADKALDRSKQLGRNRLTLAGAARTNCSPETCRGSALRLNRSRTDNEKQTFGLRTSEFKEPCYLPVTATP